MSWSGFWATFKLFAKWLKKNPYSKSNKNEFPFYLKQLLEMNQLHFQNVLRGKKLLMFPFSFRTWRLISNLWHNLQANNILSFWGKTHIPRLTHYTKTSTDCINYRCYQSTTEKNTSCILRLTIIFDWF